MQVSTMMDYSLQSSKEQNARVLAVLGNAYTPEKVSLAPALSIFKAGLSLSKPITHVLLSTCLCLEVGEHSTWLS